MCSFGLLLLEDGVGAVPNLVPQLGGHLEAVHSLPLLKTACLGDVVAAAAGGTGHPVESVDGHLPRVPLHLLGDGLVPGDDVRLPAWGHGGAPLPSHKQNKLGNIFKTVF